MFPMPATTTMALFTGGGLGWMEIVVIMGIGLLIFGRRLPEVGRNFGRGIVEFKKGLRGIEEEVDDAAAMDEKGGPARIDAAKSDQTVVDSTQKESDKVEA